MLRHGRFRSDPSVALRGSLHRTVIQSSISPLFSPSNHAFTLTMPHPSSIIQQLRSSLAFGCSSRSQGEHHRMYVCRWCDQPTRGRYEQRDHVRSFSRTTISSYLYLYLRAIDVFVRKKVVGRGDSQEVGGARDRLSGHDVALTVR